MGSGLLGPGLEGGGLEGGGGLMVIDCILTTLLHSYSLCVFIYTYMYDTRWMYLTLILLAAVMRVAGSDYEDIVLSWILFMAWMYTLSYGRGVRFMGPYLVMIKEVLVQRLSICLSVCLSLAPLLLHLLHVRPSVCHSV